VVIVGAHNPVVAALIETAGFDGIWISSLEMSLMHALDDRNLLGIHEVAESVHYIRSATGLPIVVDADNGYGAAENTRRAVREYEAVGANAVCIEDSVFPKVNSFAGADIDLLPVAEHQRRIAAAKAAQQDRDFLVIARTEALIRDRGFDEALTRCKAAAAAGADMVLMHSKEKGGEQALQAARAWDGGLPLAVVPTAFPEIAPTELHMAGFSLVIYANQLLRASVRAVQDALMGLRDKKLVDASCISMADLLKFANSFGMS
jgi:phosphoenolpyruvate phosphomutase